MCRKVHSQGIQKPIVFLMGKERFDEREKKAHSLKGRTRGSRGKNIL